MTHEARDANSHIVQNIKTCERQHAMASVRECPITATGETMDDSKKDVLIQPDEEARDEKEQPSKAGERKPSSVNVIATDKVRTETSMDEQEPKKPPKFPVLVIEINENTGKSVNTGGKTSDATGAKPVAPTASAAAATSSAPKPKAQSNPELQKPKSTTTNVGAYALLAQAAMQSSSLAVDANNSGSPTDTTPIPNVTPPTLPQDHPADGPSSPPSPYSTSARKRRGIPHTYRDYSQEPDSPTFVRKRAGGVTKPFPEKLHEMLTEESDSLDVVGWLPHGRAFIVRKPKDFTENIMGKYFRQTKLTSFQRQLNLCKKYHESWCMFSKVVFSSISLHRY